MLFATETFMVSVNIKLWTALPRMQNLQFFFQWNFLRFTNMAIAVVCSKFKMWIRLSHHHAFTRIVIGNMWTANISITFMWLVIAERSIERLSILQTGVKVSRKRWWSNQFSGNLKWKPDMITYGAVQIIEKD